MSKNHPTSTFQVGDRVRFDYGRRKLTGVIVEDRGAIGVGGRRLFRVEVPMEPFEPMAVELPDVEIEALAAGDDRATCIDKRKVLAYLANGGLVSILRSNLSGGKNQPRAWLCLDNLGNVTHTFISDRGLIGGQLIPISSLHHDKIFAPRRETVVSFVESFGLNHQDAAEVVEEVGTVR